MIEHYLPDLAGKNVLIVEDDYVIAMEMAKAVEQAGARVLGPAPDVETAFAIVEENGVDAALLDIRLGDETAFPIAQRLEEMGVAVVFITGYDDWFIPGDLDEIPIYRKPTDPENVVRILFEAVKRREG